MLLKTPVSTPWATPRTRRLLSPASILVGLLLGAAIVRWRFPAAFAASPKAPVLLLVAAVAAVVAFGLHRLSLRAASRSREQRLAEEAALELEQIRQGDTDLRAAIARHQAALESLSGGFVILDRLDRYIHVSPGASRVLGCEGLRLGRRLFHDLSEKDAQTFYVALARAKQSGQPEEVEFSCVQASRWLASRIQPSGETTTIFFRDISEQRSTLERVREAEDSFRLFTENVQDVFWVVDVPERRPVYASPSWEQLTGLPVSFFHDNPRAALELVHRADRERVCEHLLRCGADAQSQRCEIEFRIVRHDGETRWIHQRSVAIHDENGQVTRLSGFASDITVRKQMEANLRSSEMRFRSLSDSSPVGIFRTDLHQRVLDVNKRLLEICNLPNTSVTNRRLIDLIQADDRARVLDQWLRVDREGAWECRLASTGDSVRTVLMRVAADYGPEGEQVGYIGTLSDLTEYREVQNRLAMSERMASLGTLAAGVGHEINNPLTYLMCNLELAQHSLAALAQDASPAARIERTSQFLRIALDGCCRIRDIVQELRVFGRSENEHVGAVDATACVETALNIAFNQVRHRARIIRNFENIPRVRADETRLGQVFLNLIVNAAHAIPEGHADQNSITISSRLDEANQRVVFSFSDTGTGIAPELRTRIFDPFFTTKSVGEGSGLGLFLSQQTLRSYGGSIELESEVGRGSTFHVVLSLADTNPLESSPPIPEEPLYSLPRSRILVIDDEREVGLAISAMLDADHEVCVVEQASQALQLLESSSFDLILCDLMMPTMNACEFFRALQRESPDHIARVYFMTGGAFTDATRSFLAEVERPLIHKPFSLASLKSAVQQALDLSAREAA